MCCICRAFGHQFAKGGPAKRFQFAIKVVVKDSHHGARISGFSPDQKELFYSKLEKWIGQKVSRQ